MRIIKGDKVKVVKGKDRGREGTVSQTFPRSGKVLVEGVNLYKKHVKPNSSQKSGGIVEISRPLRMENVRLIDPKTGETTRVGYKIVKDQKVRFSKKSEEIFAGVKR